MYIMCVILYLLSALSRWVGALQISIIITITIIIIIIIIIIPAADFVSSRRSHIKHKTVLWNITITAIVMIRLIVEDRYIMYVKKNQYD